MSQKINDKIDKRFIEMLTRGINHDLSAPVRHVTFFTQMLNDKKAELSMSDEHITWLDHISNSGQQMQTMLLGITELAKIMTDKPQFIDIDIKKIFSSSIEEIKVDLLVEGIDVGGTNIEYTPELWPNLSVNYQHWKRLIHNLVKNALMYHPKNSEHRAQLKLNCEKSDHHLMFSVEDNGIGLSDHNKQDLPKAFKRFVHHADYPGIGMGLMHCWLIAELNNGQLELSDSELGGLKVTYTQAL